jgi:hypothetical protein
MRTATCILGAGLALTVNGAATAEPSGAEPSGAEPASCLAEPVVLRRFGVAEPQLLSLTDCEQRPNPAALPLISALAMPASESAVAAEDERVQPAALGDEQNRASPDRLNPELLVRLQQIAARFPDRAIEIVSGYRTRARATSRHRTGDALDLRIEGVDNEDLSTFARTLEQTGVGYYPNSTFVHIDVRDAAAYWVDRSAPGERPDYAREPPDAKGAPVEVHAGTTVEAERDALSAPVARALLDVHGPELPVLADDEETAAGRVATEAAPPTAAETTSESAEPVAAEAVADEVPQAIEAAGQDADAIDAAQLEAEIQSLLERALLVMQQHAAAG